MVRKLTTPGRQLPMEAVRDWPKGTPIYISELWKGRPDHEGWAIFGEADAAHVTLAWYDGDQDVVLYFDRFGIDWFAWMYDWGRLGGGSHA